MIDLHSHILPGLDDGPDDLSGSLEMARAAVAAGIETMVATPHVDHRYGLDSATIEAAVLRLDGELAAREIPLTVMAGGEVAPARLPELDRAERRALCLASGPYLLVECPFSRRVDELEALVLELRREGQAVLLAHPERCPAFLADPGRLDRLVGEGVLCCLTAGAVRGEFGGTVRRLSLSLLDRGLAHAVASDAHDHWRRPPRLELAGALGGSPVSAEEERWLTTLAPGAILVGGAMLPRPSGAPAGVVDARPQGGVRAHSR